VFDTFLAWLTLIALDFAGFAFETGAWFGWFFDTFCSAANTVLAGARHTAFQFEAIACFACHSYTSFGLTSGGGGRHGCP